MWELQYEAAVLHEVGAPLAIETVRATALKPTDVLVRLKAVGLCHTDLEAIEGQLRNPLPIVLGHEAAGIVEAVGPDARGVTVGDHVVLSWNPHCGHCFYCDRDLPILCETYLREGPKAKQFDGESRAHLTDGRELHHLMYLGAFGQYCIVPDQSAVPVSRDIDFAAACLIGCGVMTGVGAALNIAEIGFGDVVLVLGCGAVGLSAVQGARLAGAGRIVAVDLHESRLEHAAKLGATDLVRLGDRDPVEVSRALTAGRGADVVLEAAGTPAAFRASMEAVRPGGQVIWLGKTDVAADVAFRWGSLMQEKRVRRSSYGGARPRSDFPRLVDAYLDGRIDLDSLISRRIRLDEINEGFRALKAGETIRSVVVMS